MKAFVIDRHGGIDQLRKETGLTPPAVDDYTALVHIRATSINPIDILVREGYPGMGLSFPHVLGADVAGVVEETGPQVQSLRTGDRVTAWPIIACGQCALCRQGRPGLCLYWKYVGMHVNGTYADYIALPADNWITIPEEVSFEQAATLPVAGLTAYHGLMGVGDLQPSKTVFIWGGSGGLGTFAIQIAKGHGARVITTVGSDQKRERAEALGADVVLNHHEDDIPSRVRDLTSGEGVELVFDTSGAATFPISFEMLRKGGRLLLCSLATGRETQLSIHQTYLRHLTIAGLYLGEKEELEALLKLLVDGRVRPVIDRVLEFDEIPEGQRLLEAGERFGKLVVTV